MNTSNETLDISLREILDNFIRDHDITVTSIADEIGIHKTTLDKFLEGISDLKFKQAIKLMKLLSLTERQFVDAYCKDIEINEVSSLEKYERISYIAKNFDIPTLKKIGIIKSRAKMDEYEDSICSFFGFTSIYEYGDTSLSPTLFSKSKRRMTEEKESKMTTFWLKCSITTFSKINNPNEYNRELLLQLLKRVSEFTSDEVNGYKRLIYVLYQLGVTVITQSYISGTKSFGVAMILDGKPCIVITDMNKKYHKLWISLLHELYHIINDYDMLESMEYHISDSESPDLLLSEKNADQFALDVLIHPSIQEQLKKIVAFPSKVNMLARELKVSPSIIRGVYLESIMDKKIKSKEFSKYNNDYLLIPSSAAVEGILFDAIERNSLTEAIEKMKNSLIQRAI